MIMRVPVPPEATDRSPPRLKPLSVHFDRSSIRVGCCCEGFVRDPVESWSTSAYVGAPDDCQTARARVPRIVRSVTSRREPTQLSTAVAHKPSATTADADGCIGSKWRIVFKSRRDRSVPQVGPHRRMIMPAARSM